MLLETPTSHFLNNWKMTGYIYQNLEIVQQWHLCMVQVDLVGGDELDLLIYSCQDLGNFWILCFCRLWSALVFILIVEFLDGPKALSIGIWKPCKQIRTKWLRSIKEIQLYFGRRGLELSAGCIDQTNVWVFLALLCGSSYFVIWDSLFFFIFLQV